MNKIPTAEEFMESHNMSSSDNRKKILIEFAKLHVEAALKEASEKVTCSEETQYDEYDNAVLIAKIDKDSILNAYPLSNIR